MALCKTFIIVILLPTFLCSCSLINSFNLSMRLTEGSENIEGRTYQTKSLFEDFPRSLPGINVKGVDNPAKYANGDMSFKIRPSLHLEKLMMYTKARLDTSPSGQTIYYPPLKIKRLSALMNLRWTMHSALGAFYLSAGLGQSYNRFTDNLTINKVFYREVRKFEIAYIGFLSERIYVNLSARVLLSYLDTKSIALKIGYVLGEF